MISVIIPAGGTGSRYDKTKSKLDEIIFDKTVLEHTLSAFVNHNDINEIILAHPPHETEKFEQLTHKQSPKVKLTCGGSTRAESVYNAFLELSPTSHVLIHDAARPNVSTKLINDVILKLKHAPVVIPGIPVTDTLKKVADGQIINTVDRSELMAVQTPQGFHYNQLKSAYETVNDIQQLTDEAALLESVNLPGIIIDGDSSNIKITHANDLAICKALMAK